MLEFETEVKEVIQRTRNVKSFRFKVEKDIDFKAGQFFFVTIKILDKEATKHFSFSNSPTEKDYIEFTKRITDSEFSHALDKLKPGDWAKLRLPLGDFTLKEEYHKIAFLSGGIGITPIRSICKFVTDKRLPVDIFLLYGNDTKEDIIFKDDLDKMGLDNKRFHLVYSLISPLIDKKNWNGETGYIDEVMIKEEISDYRERIFYICGPPNMVKKIQDILKDRLSIKEDRIKIENFSGY